MHLSVLQMSYVNRMEIKRTNTNQFENNILTGYCEAKDKKNVMKMLPSS